MEYWVRAAKAQSEGTGDGSRDRPFTAINQALALAGPGDTVHVEPGIYRETVTPLRGGEEGSPLSLIAVDPHAAVVRGSERIAEMVGPGVHVFSIPNGQLGPFGMTLNGSRRGGCCGQVFHGAQELREASAKEEAERTPGTWRALEGGRQVLVHIPGGSAPADIEASVRSRLFAPKTRGMGYIRVEGLVFERCGNQSAAAFWEANNTQTGAVGLRAGHHITLKNCIIRNAKTIGIDLGVEGGKDAVDDIVPHDNQVEDCLIEGNGECGACGRLSRRTAIRRCVVQGNAHLSLHTVEEAGLKFHQFIDGIIDSCIVRDNDAAGIWLDAVWHGARVTRCLVVNNLGSGIFMELGAEKATVDHNVVAYTRLGDGIYTHDASDLVIAHNLVFGCSHFGIYMRTVTERPFEHKDGKFRPAECSRNLLHANLLIDNYRGHICLPAESPRSKGNASQHNHFINGTQWQWEGAGFHRFALGDNDGGVPRAQVVGQLAKAGQGAADPEYGVSLPVWQALGYDMTSFAPGAFRITSQNGAVVKGTATLSPKDMFLELRLSQEAVSPPAPSLPAGSGLDADFFGAPRGAESSPGPFVSLGAGRTLLDLDPRPTPTLPKDQA